MLKLINVANVKKVYNESDFYVPVNIKFEHWNSVIEPRHCWGFSNLDGKFLLEIAIGKETGELKYITLVSSPRVCQGAPLMEFEHLDNEIIGLPCFEVGKWGNDYYYTKEKIDFSIYIDRRNLFIVLLNNEITKIVKNDRVVFGFDENDILCLIKIVGMTLNEEGFLEEVI